MTQLTAIEGDTLALCRLDMCRSGNFSTKADKDTFKDGWPSYDCVLDTREKGSIKNVDRDLIS